jgi:hypothetical protein
MRGCVIDWEDTRLALESGEARVVRRLGILPAKDLQGYAIAAALVLREEDVARTPLSQIRDDPVALNGREGGAAQGERRLGDLVRVAVRRPSIRPARFGKLVQGDARAQSQRRLQVLLAPLLLDGRRTGSGSRRWVHMRCSLWTGHEGLPGPASSDCRESFVQVYLLAVRSPAVKPIAAVSKWFTLQT